MAKNSIWQKITSKVKKWFGGNDGGGSTKKKKKEPPQPRAVSNNRDARNQTVSSRTGAGSTFNKRELVNSLNAQKKEEDRVKDAFKAKTTVEYKSISDATKSDKKTPPKPRLTEKQELIEKSRVKRKSDLDELQAKIEAKLDPQKRKEKHEAYHAATKHRYDVAEEGISKEERDRRKQNIRTATLGEMVGGREDEALDVMKAKMKYDRTGESAKRGVVGGATLGAIDLAGKRLAKGGYKEAEEYYQANKNKGAETAGRLVGAMIPYGGTAGTFESIGANAVGRAAETQIGRKLGAEALKKTMAGTGVKAALARSLVGDAIQDSTIGLADTMMDVATRDDLKTPSDYAKAIAEGQLINYGMGLAGNAVSHALPAARRAWGSFADESRRLHIVPPSVADTVEATAKGAELKPRTKTVIANDLDAGTRKALIAESNDLDDEWWALRESIEEEYGSANPNYRELTPEQRVDITEKKTRMQEITARKNEISEELRIVRRVEEPQNGASVDAPEKGAYNNIQEEANGETIGDVRRAQAGGEAVPAVTGNVSRGAGADNKAVAGVADASGDAGRRSGTGTLRISSENRAKLTESGVTDTRLSDVSDNYAAFSNALEEARAANAHGGWVDPQSVDDLAASNAKTYLSDDGRAGVAVKKDGDICGVFKHPESKHRGASYDLVYTARANGGTKMDCYGQALVNRYEAVGYKPVARIPFNAEYVSDPKLLEDMPDVYVLMKNTDDLDTVASKIKKSEQAGGYHRSTVDELDKLPSFDDYDEALAYRDNLLKQQEASLKAETKTKKSASKSKKGVKTAGESRYDELVAERERLMDDVFSKREKADPSVVERINEINEEIKRLNPKKAGASTKAGVPKGASKAGTKKGAKKAAEKLEPKSKSNADTLKTYKENRLKENPEAVFNKTKTQGEVKEVELKQQKVTEPSKTKVTKTKTGAELKATTTKSKKAEKATQEAKEEGFGKDYAVLKEKIDEADRLRGRIRVAQGANKEALQGQLDALEKEIQFDKDFADFRRTIGNAKTNIAELENKLRVAEGKEAKAAIRKQIKKLKKDVDAAHKKAGLRYHPDKGGSNEWMAKFNETYDSFKNGGNSKPPKGEAAKPVRTVSNVEEVVHKKRGEISSKEKVKNAYQAAKRKTVNSMASFEDENLKSVKTDHAGWERRNAATDRHRRYNALAVRSVDEAQLMSNGKRYSGTVERIGADGKTYEIQNGKSLKQIYDGMDEKAETAFDAYLLLRHAPDRIREGTPIFDRINLDRANGEPIKNLNDPKVVKEEAERLLKEHPEFAQKAEEIYQYTQNELENRVRAGLLSQKKASEWMHNHPFYVPTGRDGYFNAVHGNHKGVIGADSLKAATGSDLDIRSIKEQLAEATSRNWRDITANDLLEEFFGDQVAKVRPDTKGLKLLNETVGLGKSADGRKFYAKIFRDGKMHRVEIGKGYYDDLEDLYKNGSVGPVADTIASATATFSGTFKKLVTTWNPIFLPKNFSRDMQDALVNTRQTKEFVECLGPAWKELCTDGEFARAFKDSGVSQANFVNLNESLGGKGGKLGKAIDKFVALQDMTESFPRLAEFMATLKKNGVDISNPESLKDVDPKLLDIAAANAADVTVNFGRSGSVGKNLNKGLVPFLNPSIQGWSKFTRNFREQRGMKQLLGTLVKASALGAGTVALNNFLLEDNPNYQQISNREKATNIIIAWPPFKADKDGLHLNNDTDVFIKIPRGRFAAVYGLATVNANNENDMGWAEMIKVARDQVLPVDPTESSLFGPLYNAHNNETWYGAPIESDYLVDNFSPSERYDTSTSPFGKALGKATSGLPEELQISPKKADYVIDAATGVIGDFGLPISTAVANGDSAKEAGTRVLKKAFTIDSATQSDLYSRFHNQATSLEHKKNSSRATAEDEKAYKKFNSWDSRVKNVTNAMRYVQDSDMPNKQEAYRELSKLRNEDMKKALAGKVSLNNTRDIDTIHKYAGTSYTIENLGKSADQKALKAYGAAVYGNLSEDEMKKKIDSDTEFYKGYKGITKTQNALQKVDPKLKGGNALTYAVGLADAGANDDVFASYGTTIQSRTESASKAQRAKDYLKNNGSVEEFAQLENAVKNLGKLSDVDKDKLEDEAYSKLQRGEMSIDDYNTELKKISYNANLSYVGKAVSLAQSGAPARAYNLYDIKDKNVQKGYNLAAMGIDSRKYREMSQACDKDGNGYLKSAEIRDYVANSDVEDKATLFDALCYYPNVRNPFGTPKHYSAERAAEVGKQNGVKQINVNAGADNTVFNESKSGSSGYSGYYRRGYHRRGYHRRGGGGKAKAPAIKQSAFKAGKAKYTDLASTLKKAPPSVVSATKASTVKIEPPNVKFKKYEV